MVIEEEQFRYTRVAAIKKWGVYFTPPLGVSAILLEHEWCPDNVVNALLRVMHGNPHCTSSLASHVEANK